MSIAACVSVAGGSRRELSAHHGCWHREGTRDGGQLVEQLPDEGAVAHQEHARIHACSKHAALI